MLLAAILLTACPQDPAPTTAVRAWRTEHEAEVLAEFRELLAIPNHGADLPDIERNAEWIRDALRRRDVAAELVKVGYAPPVVRGEIRVPGAERTVVLYAHYDGQPVDPPAWTSGPPFEPTLYSKAIDDGGEPIAWPGQGESVDPEARVYARSAGDDKAAIVAMLAALDAMRAAGIRSRCNVRFLFEGEEEMGSRHLRQLLVQHTEAFAGDVFVFCDGPVHQTRRPQVVFGVRGICGLDITIYGARRPLHSGHYGNWAPNPAMALAHLLASMKDDDGRVLVDGFYDDVEPLSDADRAALAAAPDVDAMLRDELWLGATEGDARLDERLTLPSLNLRGLSSANVGRLGRNVVPDTATASIDCRLVKGMDPERTIDRILAHVRAQGYHLVTDEPDAATRRTHPKVARVVPRYGYRAVRASMDDPAARAVARAVRAAHDDLVVLPTLGGSLPLATIDDVLGVPVVVVGIANHDDNQHAANENMRVQNLWDGIETMAALLTLTW